MGLSEYAGNMSVHWRVVHEDDKGQPVKLSAKAGQQTTPKKGHDVHVEKGARGRDPVVVADVGRRKGHSGHFRVRLRFERMQDARQAAAAVQSVMFEDGMYVLVLDVPLIQRADADDPPPAEVRIDW
jgi:hypothetical protein